MLQGALVKFDKTVFLRKICYRNGLIMCIAIHETRHQKLIWIVDIYPKFISIVKQFGG